MERFNWENEDIDIGLIVNPKSESKNEGFSQEVYLSAIKKYQSPF
ncbi:hypothetical protein [Arcicella aurantiaca]|nr:hypothetical protein [Arcicella aurantiaca]